MVLTHFLPPWLSASFSILFFACTISYSLFYNTLSINTTSLHQKRDRNNEDDDDDDDDDEDNQVIKELYRLINNTNHQHQKQQQQQQQQQQKKSQYQHHLKKGSGSKPSRIRQEEEEEEEITNINKQPIKGRYSIHEKSLDKQQRMFNHLINIDK